MERVVLEQLRALPVYRALTDEDLALLATVARTRLYARGERIFESGDPAEHFHVILRGRVKIQRTTPAGKELTLTLLGPGDPVGAVAVYREMPFPASAEALEDTVMIEIPAGSFFALLKESPTLVRGLLDGLTARLVELTNRLSALTGTHVIPRFARLFLRLADKMGRDSEQGLHIPMPLSRQELADLTGTTIETCIRVMSQWGKEEVVITRDDGFLIRNRAVLEQLSRQS